MGMEEKARALAEKHGIEVTDEGDVIEVWALQAQFHVDSGGHCDFIHRDEYSRKAHQWGAVLSVLEWMIEHKESGGMDTCTDCGYVSAA